ncbi:MAG: helix-turn-helix domain-containing protein [Chloroflexi bacterium]|jgi:transcriptional regulator with XRE-family HTH domain|nr:helix-turn-helix domain-containing protein [Chloroflexota bacterium]
MIDTGDDRHVDDIGFGRAMRAIRIGSRLRQVDVARRAGISQCAVSDVERGFAEGFSLRTLRALAAALGAQAMLDLRWRGGEVDRLLDEGHAHIVSSSVALLERLGWETVTEVTYSRFGERGSYDILAIHRPTGAVVAVEVKTRIVSLEETLRRLDQKARLAPLVATERFGAKPRVVGRMLVLPEGGVSRRAIGRHEAVLRRALPVRGLEARSWLADPSAPASLLLLVRPAGKLPASARCRVSAPRLHAGAVPLVGGPAPRDRADSHRRHAPRGDTRRRDPG